jgi:hypothetical protein
VPYIGQSSVPQRRTRRPHSRECAVLKGHALSVIESDFPDDVFGKGPFISTVLGIEIDHQFAGLRFRGLTAKFGVHTTICWPKVSLVGPVTSPRSLPPFVPSVRVTALFDGRATCS